MMKVYTSSKSIILVALIYVLSSCGDATKKEEKNLDSTTAITAVSIVTAIAKVQPAGGIIALSSATGGIVEQVLKQSGDTIKKGDLIVVLANDPATNSVETVRAQINTQIKRAAIDQKDVLQFRVSLAEKTEDLAITERLATTGADTRQNVEVKRREKSVLQSNLEAAIDRVAASKSEIVVLQEQLKQIRSQLDEKNIYAQEDGILLSVDSKKGAALQALQPFATMAPWGDLILEGEIEEMFASQVQIGDSLTVNFVGRQEKVASGVVTYLSPILDSKSLFYETPGEMNDRRVRRFKASLHAIRPLLINSKVECTIRLHSND